MATQVIQHHHASTASLPPLIPGCFNPASTDAPFSRLAHNARLHRSSTLAAADRYQSPSERGALDCPVRK
jgi:hypothetical protein